MHIQFTLFSVISGRFNYRIFHTLSFLVFLPHVFTEFLLEVYGRGCYTKLT